MGNDKSKFSTSIPLTQTKIEIPTEKELTPEERNVKMEECKNKGNDKFKVLDYEGAIKEYKKAIFYSESSPIYSNIARCYLV